MTAAGWTSREFDETPLPVVFDLLEYWAENPPTHLIQAAKAGLGKRKRKGTRQHRVRKPEDLKPVDEAYERSLPPWVQEARKLERERIRNG
jgi:hypothetical protein